MRMVLIGAATALFTTTALAQSGLSHFGLACSDFRESDNGLWTPNHHITINGPSGEVTISPALSFRAGLAFMGVDLGTMLDQECR
jgi:hypothetical protein